MPEDGYHGEDIIGIGKTLADEFGDKFVEMPMKKNALNFSVNMG